MTVTAYSQFEPPTGGPVTFTVPMYMADTTAMGYSYNQTGSCSLVFTPDTRADSVLPYGYAGYTTANAIWSNTGAALQNPLSPSPNLF